MQYQQQRWQSPHSNQAVQVSQPSQTGWWSRLFGRTSATAEAQYQALLDSAQAEDFSDLDTLGFLSCPANTCDKLGRPVLLVVAKNFPAKVVPPERLLRYIAARCHVITQQPYTCVWFHTQATYWQNCPSLWWLWGTYERLPVHYRDNLATLHCVHCDLPLWGALSVLGPWLSGALWRKINWVSRVEFLWDHVNKRSIDVPAFVAEHDAMLEDQPLMDYGIMATKEAQAAVPGMPAPI